jgi:hypothetical protein
MGGLRWTHKATRNLADALTQRGVAITHVTGSCRPEKATRSSGVWKWHSTLVLPELRFACSGLLSPASTK